MGSQGQPYNQEVLEMGNLQPTTDTRPSMGATWKPPATPMVLVFDPGQPKPQVYVQPGQLLANGRAPKSSSTVLIGGESWLQFSFNISWNEEDGITRFLTAARQRFMQDE